MALAGWDVASIYISYNIVFFFRIGRWEGLSTGLLAGLCTWLIISYVTGKYSPEPGGGKEWRNFFASSIAAGAGIIVLFVIHSWAYQVVDASTRFRGFLVPFVALSLILSSAGKQSFNLRNGSTIRWKAICSDAEEQIIKDELQAERIAIDIMFNQDLNNYQEQEDRYGNERNAVVIGSLGGTVKGVENQLIDLREKGCEILSIIDWCERYLHRIPPELVDKKWLIRADGFKLRPGRTSWRIKRLVDIVVALTLLVVTSPVVALAAICIWIEDRGPILYCQMRTGTNGGLIKIWKLRSMKRNAEALGPQWSKKGDQRVTKVGKVIRKIRVDELPQLVGVVRGELSLIGPRPERPEIESEIEKYIPNYRVRHWVRPGLSGWAQVCYPYGASIRDSRNKLSYDIYYIRNGGFLLDLLIFAKTIRLVATGSGSKPIGEVDIETKEEKA